MTISLGEQLELMNIFESVTNNAETKAALTDTIDDTNYTVVSLEDVFAQIDEGL